MRHTIGLLAAALLVTPARADTKFELNGDNTKITFVGSKPDGKHTGGFKKLKGTASYDGKDPATLKLEVEIDTESLFSDNDKLTTHLKSPDFFAVKTHPTSKFVVKKVEKAERRYAVFGDLTLLGKTRPVMFMASIESDNTSLAISSDFTIDRTEFGMTFGQGKVDNIVQLKVAVEAKK